MKKIFQCYDQSGVLSPKHAYSTGFLLAGTVAAGRYGTTSSTLYNDDDKT